MLLYTAHYHQPYTYYVMQYNLLYMQISLFVHCKNKVLPDYKINWNFDNSELGFNNLEKNQINLFDIEKFLKK